VVRLNSEERLVRGSCFIFVCCVLLILSGCAAAVVGGGAAGGYAVATDERSSGGMLDDSAITAKVNKELIGDEQVKAVDVDVDTIDGVVILSGFVDSQGQRSRAGEIAGKVPGVVRVKNNLLIGSRTIGQGLDDKVLGSKIKAKLIEAPGVRSLNVDVDVYLGNVSLTGIVGSEAEKKTIIGIARSVQGTKKIIDNIIVR